jgi:hypothetical protein
MTMSQDWGKRSARGGQDSGEAGEATERFYMNKAYGRSLERARALDARPGGQQDSQQDGAFRRVTIEPETGGGHRVIVEHSTTVIGGHDEEPAERSEHSFAKPEDAVQFLQDILRGRLPGGSEDKDEGDPGSSGARGGRNEGHGSGIESPIEDALGGAGGRG